MLGKREAAMHRPQVLLLAINPCIAVFSVNIKYNCVFNPSPPGSSAPLQYLFNLWRIFCDNNTTRFNADFKIRRYIINFYKSGLSTGYR